MNDVSACLNECLKGSKLKINFEKTNFMEFGTDRKRINPNVSCYNNRTFEEVGTTKFLSLQIGNNLN